MFERLKKFLSGANVAGAASAAKPTTTEIAREVIAGNWGSGEKRIEALKKAGYNPTEIQNEVNRLLCCRELIIQNMKAWATKIANSHKYKYIYYTEKYGKECAVCHPHNGENKGWQCIGWGFAVWHHGGLPSNCNCGVIGDGTWEKIYNAKTDAEALKIAQQCIGIKDIQVIRNKKGIPKSQTKPGDIAARFDDSNKFRHVYVIMSDKYVSDSSHAGGFRGDISATRAFNDRYIKGMKMLIRYTGNGLTTPAKKSVDELAHEVIDGKWGSGASRKQALTECKYDYEAIQKRVSEILNPPKKSIDEVAREVLDGKWGSGETRKKRLTEAGYDYNAVQKRVNEIIEERKKKYPGVLPTTKLVKTNAEVIADTIKWAKWIASDNRFHYGYTNKHGSTKSKDWNPNAHHNGCYFCGTNTTKGGRSKKGIVDYQFTYCCNPFVGAAWAHGGCVPKAMQLCSKGSSWDFTAGQGYDTCSLFTKLGKPATSKLKPGDVLCKNGGHVALYIGDGKVVQAGGGDDNVRNSKKWNNSISIGTWNKWERAYRFNSSVNTTAIIKHGEVSERVKLWQAFLDWYYDGKVGKADGYYGDNTLKWTKKFQEEVIGKGEGDGLIGDKTLTAAKNVRK